MTYAIAKLWHKYDRQSEGDTYVVPWPYDTPNISVLLRAGPFDTLEETQQAFLTWSPKERIA